MIVLSRTNAGAEKTMQNALEMDANRPREHGL